MFLERPFNRVEDEVARAFAGAVLIWRIVPAEVLRR